METETANIKQKLLRDIKKLKSSIGYLNAGYPGYNTLYGRDSLISAWQMLKIDSSIAQATLKILAKHQGKVINEKTGEEPGKILHHYYAKKQIHFDSIDSTPLFIILIAKYFQQTKDKKFLLKIWDNIMNAFNWIKRYGDNDNDGYIEYQRKSPNMLFHQGWRDSYKNHLLIKPPVAIVEAQGYVYAAYQGLSLLAKKLGKYHISKEAITRSKILKKKFNKDFWMSKEKYFALALDGRKRQRKAITSNVGHLLFTGIIEKNKMKYVVSRLFEPDLYTNYGIRTHSSKEPDFNPYSYHLGSVWPHDNWIIYQGLLAGGFKSYANKIKNSLLKAYQEIGKIPELYAVINNKIIDLSVSKIKGVKRASANPVQAWASAGLLALIWKNGK